MNTTPLINLSRAWRALRDKSATFWTAISALMLATAAAQADTLVLFPNGDFDHPAGTNTPWVETFGGGTTTYSYPTTGGNPGGYGVMDNTAAGGGWAIWVGGNTTPLPLAPMGMVAGGTYTFVQDMVTLASGGGFEGGVKIESWGPNGYISGSGEMRAGTESGSWANYSFPYTIAAGATGIKVVPLWAQNAVVGYDNLGVMVPPQSLVAEITSPADSATVSTNFTINASATVSPGAVTNVYFYDGVNLLGNDTTYPYSFAVSGATLGAHVLKVVAKDNGGISATSTVVNITVAGLPPPIPTHPTNNAPTPTWPAASVVSLYNSSATYTDHTPVNWYPWGATASRGDYAISGGRVVKSYLGLQYAGVEPNPTYNPATALDLSGVNTMHVDVWTTANQFGIQLQSTVGANGNQGAIDLIQASSDIIASNHWVSLDIPLSVFTNLNPLLDLTKLDQVLWLDNFGAGVQQGDFYFDNIYFYSNDVAPPVVINYPTNNAPVPTQLAAKVISLYTSSGTYAPVSIDTWLTGWSAATVGDFMITNANSWVVKEYDALNYAGVEFLNPGPTIDASAMTTLHVDLWTPNATKFSIKLVSDVGLGSQAEHEVLFNSSTITNKGWISLDIPLSQFAGVNLANLGQLLWIDNNPGGPEYGTFFVDNVYFYDNGLVVINYPTNAAPTPTMPAANVKSLYTSSSTYTDEAVDTWLTVWSAASETDYTITNANRVVKQYWNLNYAGVEFLNPGPTIDASAMTTFHFDLWTPDATKFSIKLVSDVGLAGQAERQVDFTSSTITNQHWISLDIPLSQFTGVNMTNLGQLLWIDNVGGVESGTFYLDNIYFYANPLVTNGVNSSIVSGTLLSWIGNSANSYQAQKSANNSVWADVGSLLSGNAATNQFDLGKAPFYRVLEMTPGGANVVPNPGFETAASPANAVGATNWNIAVLPNAGATMLVTNQYGALTPHRGGKLLFIESTTAATGPVASPNTDVRSDLFPVTAGTAYNLSFYAANPVKLGGANPQYHVFFYDAANGAVGGPIFTSFASAGAVWTQITNTITPPAGATQMTIGWIQAAGAGNGEDWVSLIDDVVLTAGAVTGPTNILSVTTQPGVKISWATGNGTNYQVQSSATVNGSWAVYSSLINGNGTTNSVTDSATAAKKFYRVLGIH